MSLLLDKSDDFERKSLCEDKPCDRKKMGVRSCWT